MVKEKWASTPYYARWLAAFFICSCLGFFIGMGLWAVSANADETDNSVYLDRMDVMPFGLEALAEGDQNHTEHGEGWTAWEYTGLSSIESGKKYYLTKAVTLSTAWEPAKGEYTICLSGNTIGGSGSSGNMIKVSSGVTLNLYDCSSNGAGNITTSGTGNATIIVESGGKLNLYSGNISERDKSGSTNNEKPQKGGGVYVAGEFNMFGGAISNNNEKEFSYTYGGGVYVDDGGVFNMSGGEITNNFAGCNYTQVGNGVYVASGGKFFMNDGKIGDNKRDGVYVDGTFEMTGGVITGNGSEHGERGLEVYGSVTIGGSAVIENNKYTTSTIAGTSITTYNDIFLDKDSLLTIQDNWEPKKTSIYGFYDWDQGRSKRALTIANEKDFSEYFVSFYPDSYAVIAEKNENGKYVLYQVPIEDVKVTSFTVNTDKVVVEPGGSAKIEVSWTPEVPDCDVSVTFHTGLYDLNNGYNKYITSADSPKYVEVHTKDNIGEATLAISLTRKKDNKIETLFTEYVELVVTNAPKITKEPEVPDGIIPGYSPAERVMQVKASGMNLKYQWYYNQSGDTTDLKNSTTTGYDSTDCTIPDLDPGTYYFFCVITNEKGTATTKTVKITFPGGTTPGGNQPSTGQTPSIPDNGQPEAPNVPEGQSPVGKDIQVNVSNPGNKELKYQWYYNQTGENNPENSTATGGNSPSCTIPDLAPGTYYFYCVITDTDGNEVISNTVPITIPEKAAGEKLEPGKTITTDDGTTEVKRDEDGGKVTIDTGENGGKPDGTTDVTIILPDDKKDGEVTVDKTTGEVTVPGGSTVKDGTGSSDGTGEGSQKPDIVIGDKGGSVTPEGEVKIPEGGTATVGGDENKTGTTVTGGSGNGNGPGNGPGSTIKPNENGTVDVTGGTTVTIGGDGSGDGDDKKGTDITLPNGGNVNPDDGTITPSKDKDGNQIAGVDTDGDGVVDTLIVLPKDPDGESTITPDETGNGGVTLPAGTEIKGNGGSGDGSGSGDGTGSGEASITLPEGGTVTPGGGIKPEGGNALTGEDDKTVVTVPDDGVIKGDGEGGLTVPGGTTIQNGDGGSKITVGDEDKPDSIGGTIDGNGNITIPEGGSATVDTDGDGEPDTTITAPTGSGDGNGNKGGSTITPNPDGTTGVSGGTTVKTGEDGTEVTVNDNDGKGGTVNKDGDIVLPPGGSVTVGGNGTGDGSGSGDGDGNKGGSTTTITVPSGTGSGSGSGDGENTTIKPGTDGDVEVPNGSKVQTDNGSGSGNTPGGTPGGDDDNQNNSTEITLPNGGNVNAGDGTITPGKDDEGKQIAGVDTDNDGVVDTVIVLPGTEGNGTITPNENGGVNVPGGTEIKNGGSDGTGKDSESTITIGSQGGSVNNEGGVDLPKGGSATVDNGTDKDGNDRPSTEITAGENGGTVKPNPEGGTDVSGQGTKVQVGGEESSKPAITVDDKGGTVTPEGNIEIKDGASVTVGGENGQPGTTITAPTGKDDGNGNGTGSSTTVTPKDDGSVDVGKGGTVTTGGQDGQGGTPVTLPAGGNVKPEDGTIQPNDNIIATGEDKDRDGIPDTVIILPEDKNTITPGTDGSITLPGGSTIQGGSDGVNVTLPEGGQITSDGGVKPSGDGDLTIKGENGQPDVSIKLPEGGAISGGKNGGLQVPQGTEIKKDGENTPTVVVGENGGSLDKNGNITLPEGGSATITDSDGKNPIEVKTPQGGTVDTATGSTTAPQVEINGTTITAPTDGRVTTDKDGVTQVGPGTVIKAQDGTKIEITEGNATLSKDGILTFPNGGKVKITKEDGTTQDRTVTNGGTIDINKLSGSGSGPSSSGHGGSSGGGGASSNAPVISKTEHGTVSITPTRPQTGDKVTLTAKPEKGYQVDSVTVVDKDGKNVTVTKNSDGTYSFTQPEGKVTISVKFRETSTTQPTMTMNYKDCGKGADCLIGQFTDCLADAWYHDGIHYCLANGLMNGTSTTTFGPNESTTRGQIVTILYRVEGEPAAGSSPFSDVASGQYYAKAVAWGAANGIVKGYSETQFAPEDKVTREQLAAILYRYAQFKGLDVSARGDLSSFSDSGAVSGYAVEAMEWAVGSGLMNGDNGALRPAGNATRAEVAMMLMRFLDK